MEMLLKYEVLMALAAQKVPGSCSTAMPTNPVKLPIALIKEII